MDRIDRVIEDVKKEMPNYLSFVYEKVAREIVMDKPDEFFNMERLGRWWDKQTEIDIVGLSREKNSILFGKAKWGRKPVGTNIFEDLRNKAEKVMWGDAGTARFFVLFSRKGFTKGMLDLAKKERIILFHGDERMGL